MKCQILFSGTETKKTMTIHIKSQNIRRYPGNASISKHKAPKAPKKGEMKANNENTNAAQHDVQTEKYATKE